MSVQHSSLLQSLVIYGEFGSIFHLETVGRHLEAHCITSKSVKIPLPTAVKVSRHLLEIIKRDDDKERSMKAWNYLLIMCDREKNSTAFDLLSEMQSTDVLSFVLRAISTLSSDQSDLVAESSLGFLTTFAKADESRQLMIGQTPGIIETLTSKMDTEFSRSPDITKITLLQALTNILGRNSQTVRTNTECFINADGFRVINATLRHLNQWATRILTMRSFTADEQTILSAFLLSLSSMFCALLYVKFTDVPKEKYMYNAISLTVTTATLQIFFSLSDNPSFKNAILAVFANYTQLVNMYMPDALEATLLYSGSAATPPALRVPFVVQVLRISRDPLLAHYQVAIMDLVTRYSSTRPAVATVASEDMNSSAVRNTPGRGLSRGVCAYPNCLLSTMISGGTMQKCARCKAVSYCGKEHQTKDWEMHKKTCACAPK